MTLIETVAGLALLATLLASMLLIKLRATAQWSRANQRLEAVAAADHMLSSWWQDRGRFPVGAEGQVPSNSTLTWRTMRIANPPIDQLRSQVVRLEISATGSLPIEPLVSVELILSNQKLRR